MQSPLSLKSIKTYIYFQISSVKSYSIVTHTINDSYNIGYVEFRLKFLTYNIGDKIAETLCSNRVTSENKTIHTLTPPLHSKLGCLLFSTGGLNSGTTLHGGDRGRKALLFAPFKVSKMSERPFRAKCLN